MENLIKTSNIVLIWKGKQLSVNVKGKRRGEIISKKKITYEVQMYLRNGK